MHTIEILDYRYCTDMSWNQNYRIRSEIVKLFEGDNMSLFYFKYGTAEHAQKLFDNITKYMYTKVLPKLYLCKANNICRTTKTNHENEAKCVINGHFLIDMLICTIILVSK